ncbi:MAG: hypothetical protein ACPGWR_10945 [Ardenticatenaceae bacterium]
MLVGALLGISLGILLTAPLWVGLRVVLAGGLGAVLATGVLIRLEEAVEESVKTGRASWLAQGAFWLLAAIYAFLVWYSYLGG